jgi:hypothetical protein
MNRQGITVMVSTLGLVAGCVAIHPEVDRRAGEAVTFATGAQTLNPQAARDPNAVSGIDGRAAKESMDRYVESFRTPQPTMNVLNIGGSLGDQQTR